jgi:endonuclease-3
VLSNCFDIPGITVDTHVTRISNLLKLVDSQDAVKIEFALMKLMPDERWNAFDHLIITHGRRTCIARRPQCQDCVIRDLCPSAL